MPRAQPAPSLARGHERLGWLLLSAGVAGGAALEGVLAMKWGPLLDDGLRREMLRLSHVHAALLGLVNLVYAGYADAERLAASRRLASRALVLGSVLLPAGFLLGGLWHPEGDPGLGVLAVPPGALAIGLATALQLRATWRRS